MFCISLVPSSKKGYGLQQVDNVVKQGILGRAQEASTLGDGEKYTHKIKVSKIRKGIKKGENMKKWIQQNFY